MRDVATEEGERVRQELAAGYTSGFRVFEIAAILAFGLLFVLATARLVPALAVHPGAIALAAVASWIFADFGSGVVHWAGDTWGTPATPVLGPTLIRTFREHHVDQTAITRHDFVETNGTNCMAPLPMLSGALAIDVAGPVRVFAIAFLVGLAAWVLITNQAHQWAHQERPSAWVRALQRTGLLLTPERHRVHHAAPYDRAYCITSGLLNPLLTRVDFFRRAEAVITALTGAVPREDDVAKTGAVAG